MYTPSHILKRLPYSLAFMFALTISLIGCGNSESSDNKGDGSRVSPLSQSELEEVNSDIVTPYEKDGEVPNFYATLARNEDMMQNWNVFKSYLMNDSTLTTRDIELVFLRAAWLTRSEYLFKLHMEDAKTAGLSDSDINNVQIDNSSSALWDASDLTILNAVDEIFLDAFIGEDAWDSLESIYTVEQIIDFLFTVGDAFLEAFVINSLKVQMDDEGDGFTSETLSSINNKTIYNGDIARTRLAEPRISILAESEWTESLEVLLEPYRRFGGSVYNIFTTLAHNEKALEKWAVDFAAYVLDSSLPPREREILILRTGWLCYAEYEFGQHLFVGKIYGLTDSDILNIIEGADAEGLSEADAVLIKAVDEIYTDSVISDDTWESLKETYDDEQLMDIVIAISEYFIVSLIANSLGVELDETLTGFPVN